jgi:hypothetical protein
VWLASASEPAALATGRYLKHRVAQRPNPQALDVGLQSGLLAALDTITGVQLTS